jgi:hypothetical protein
MILSNLPLLIYVHDCFDSIKKNSPKVKSLNPLIK